MANFVGLLVSAGIILLLFSRELFGYAVRKLTQKIVLLSAEEKGAVSRAGPLRGGTRSTVMLYASSVDG
jgi:hypothetical protein